MPRLPRHFLTGEELSREELRALLDRALELKAAPRSSDALAGRAVALLFDRPSTRTRLSFEVGIVELGGHPVVLRPGEMQLSRGESARDTARILARNVTGGRCAHGPGRRPGRAGRGGRGGRLQHADCGPSSLPGAGRPHDPARGVRRARRAAASPTSATATTSRARWRSWAPAPAWRSSCAAPEGFQLEPVTPGATARRRPARGGEGAHAVYTDVWVSMGDEQGADERRARAGPLPRRRRAARRAAPAPSRCTACPAHPGEEITAEVLYGPRQRIWDQAENRRHAQKALLEWLVAGYSVPPAALGQPSGEDVMPQPKSSSSSSGRSGSGGSQAKRSSGRASSGGARAPHRRLGAAQGAPPRAEAPRARGASGRGASSRSASSRTGSGGSASVAARRSAARPAAPASARGPGAADPRARPRRATASSSSGRQRGLRGGELGCPALDVAPATRREPRRAGAAERSQDQAQDALAAMRERLTRGVVVTADAIQEAFDEAGQAGAHAAAGRPETAADLVTRGRRQAEEFLAEVERLLGRGRAEVGSATADTRRRVADAGDRVAREVDRARRAARIPARRSSATTR